LPVDQIAIALEAGTTTVAEAYWPMIVDAIV